MAKGTCPQICATSMQSAALAFGSNSQIKDFVEALSNVVTLKP